MDELHYREYEEWIETGRRPRLPGPRPTGELKELEEALLLLGAQEVETIVAREDEWDRSYHERFLQEGGSDEFAQVWAGDWEELRMYRRVINTRNARADITRANRSRSLRALNANRQPSELQRGVETLYWRCIRMGKSPHEARQHVHDNFGGDFSKRHINRLLARCAQRPGRE